MWIFKSWWQAFFSLYFSFPDVNWVIMISMFSVKTPAWLWRMVKTIIITITNRQRSEQQAQTSEQKEEFFGCFCWESFPTLQWAAQEIRSSTGLQDTHQREENILLYAECRTTTALTRIWPQRSGERRTAVEALSWTTNSRSCSGSTARIWPTLPSRRLKSLPPCRRIETEIEAMDSSRPQDQRSRHLFFDCFGASSSMAVIWSSSLYWPSRWLSWASPWTLPFMPSLSVSFLLPPFWVFPLMCVYLKLLLLLVNFYNF